MTTDLITKYDAETNIPDVEKYQESVPEQNVDEGEANNKQLDKNDTQRIGSGSGSLFFLIFYFFASLFFLFCFVFFLFQFFFFQLIYFFNPNANSSRFVTEVYHCHIFVYKGMKCGGVHLSGTSPQTIRAAFQSRQSSYKTFLLTQAQVVEGERVEITAPNNSFAKIIHTSFECNS